MITLDENPGAGDIARVREGLRQFNESHVGDDRHQSVTVVARDEHMQALGGLLGGTYWGYLYIDVLWVDEPFRNHGIGTRLLRSAERQAEERGCRYAHVDTHSFQGVDFYKRHGDVIVGELQDLPPGTSGT